MEYSNAVDSSLPDATLADISPPALHTSTPIDYMYLSNTSDPTTQEGMGGSSLNSAPMTVSASPSHAREPYRHIPVKPCMDWGGDARIRALEEVAPAGGMWREWEAGSYHLPAGLNAQEDLSLRALLSTSSANDNFTSNYTGESKSTRPNTFRAPEFSILIMGKKIRTSRYSTRTLPPGTSSLRSADSVSSTTSSTTPPATSPTKLVYTNYAPYQEKVLWEAFNDSVYPSPDKRAELAEQLELPPKVIANFFKSKRDGLFKRLHKAGMGDKIQSIRQAHKVSARVIQLFKKEPKVKLDEAAQSTQKKPQRRKRVSKQSNDEESAAKSKDIPADKPKPQKRRRKKQMVELEKESYPVKIKTEIFPNHSDPVTENQQQQPPPQYPDGKKEYQYEPRSTWQESDPWDNKASILNTPQPFHLSGGYYGPYYSSSGNSYGFMPCHSNPWISGVNAVWAATPRSFMGNSPWTSTPSTSIPSKTENMDSGYDFQYTQNLGNTDAPYSPPFKSHAPSFSESYFDHSNQQDFGVGQFHDQMYFGSSTSSASPSFEQCPSAAAASAYNSSSQSPQAIGYSQDPDPSPEKGVSHGTNPSAGIKPSQDIPSTQNFPPDPLHDPAEDPSASIGLYPPTILTLTQPRLSPDLHCSPSMAQDDDALQNSSQSPKSDSSQANTTTESGASQNCLAFDTEPLPAPTPPLDLTMESAPPPTAPLKDMSPPHAPYHVYLPHTTPPHHRHYTQPAAYGVRLWMAMGDSFSSTVGEVTPDPNRSFTYYPNISGVQSGGGEDGDTDSEGFS